MANADTIAQLIAGDEPPRWLTPAVQKLCTTLKWAVAKEAEYPTRQELRKKLKALANAIDVVRGSLRDFQISTLLLSREHGFQHQNEMDHALSNYADMVGGEMIKIPSGPGSNKHFASPQGLSCAVNCALMVCLIWERVHDRWPPKSNHTAHNACASLWAAAGGRTLYKPGVSDSVVVWRDHIRSAEKATSSPEAEFIQRSLDAIPGG